MRGPVQKFRRRRTKMKITRAVELRSSKFWVFWKAETILLNLNTTFMGVWTRYPATPSVRTQNVGWSCIATFIWIKKMHAYIHSVPARTFCSWPKSWFSRRHIRLSKPLYDLIDKNTHVSPDGAWDRVRPIAFRGSMKMWIGVFSRGCAA